MFCLCESQGVLIAVLISMPASKRLINFFSYASANVIDCYGTGLLAAIL